MDIIIKSSIFAVMVSFILEIVFGSMLIPFLRKLKFGQYERKDGVDSHLQKEGTPTMGGISILASLIITSMIFSPGNKQVLAILLVTLGFGIIGFWDDFVKVVKKRNLGLRAWQKIVLQAGIAIAFAYYVMNNFNIGTSIIIPFTNKLEIDLGMWFIPFSVIVIIGSVNAVNLTDGLDGLAAGITALVGTFFATITLIVASDLTPMTCTIIGSLLGFLLFNAHPAKIFMGDTGSLALGGFLASLAIMLKMPLFLVIVGIIYVSEAVSVILQVGYYKLTKKRIFRMAPIHHHFELSGLKETKVVAIFFIITAIACLIGYLAI